MEVKKISDYLPFTDGFFATMNSLPGIETPWDNERITGAELDIAFLARFGDRPASKFLKHFSVDDEVITSANLTLLTRNIYNILGRNWVRLWNAFVAEYNPIENYDMTEVETHENNLTFGHANEREIDTTNENTPRTEIETTGDFYGFNSSSPVPTGKSTVKSVAGTDKTTDSGTVTDTESGTNTDEGERTLTRHGNIGVTTSAQMITQELELWKWNYFETVFADVLKYISLPIYLNERR